MTDERPVLGQMGDGERPVGGGPLSGVLVADFSRVLAGPYATMLLADLGAEVVKVEGPEGDETRTWMPPVRDGVSTYYLGINRGKRSMTLDLRDEADAALGRELARRADVMIQNFKPGGLAKFGLDFESVSAANPGIIYASISGFGAGKGAHVPGYDLMVQAISGLMSLTGDPDGPPYRAGISVFDVMAGNHAVIGILAALRHRDATGEGQHVEVNLLSSALTGLVNHSSAWAAGGVVPYRMGNAHPSVFPYEPLPTADDDLIVAAANDRQFRKLCEVLGIPGVADDPRFARNADRTKNREELRPILVERLRQRTATEWFDDLVAVGVPCGPIQTIDGGFATAERFGLDPIVEVGGMPTTRHPIRFSATPVEYRLPPPQLDEHGAELRKWLAAPEEANHG
jgi:crotonobetainyl-CoA:carnitine CoA-transferase CaiB-like acyl-CoA transferase